MLEKKSRSLPAVTQKSGIITSSVGQPPAITYCLQLVRVEVAGYGEVSVGRSAWSGPPRQAKGTRFLDPGQDINDFASK